MLISIHTLHPKFTHEYCFKLGSGNISHHVRIESEGQAVRLVLNGLNDRQRQLIYELFGPCAHDEVANPELASGELETI